jgi:hypothetical protein
MTFDVINNSLGERTTLPELAPPSRWQRIKSRLRILWYVHVDRRIPRLVWKGDELDVLIRFKGGWEAAGDLAAVEREIRKLDIGFDTGASADGRDWEWDWSLSGPVTVTFKSRATKPEKRVPPFKITVVSSNGAA